MPRPAVKIKKIFEGKVSLYVKPNETIWQYGFKIGTQHTRKTTKTRVYAEAVEIATDAYITARVLAKAGYAIVTHAFDSVAKLAIKQMEKTDKAGVGKVTYESYINAINKYFIPYFGKVGIEKVDAVALAEFSQWRREKLGKNPAHSTLNTHNSALNRIFDLAVEKRFITQSAVPNLKNDGEKAEKRPTFLLEEYRKLYTYSRHWRKEGKQGKITQKRELLHDYFLILANTGMRHGTESYGIKWKNLSWYYKNEIRYLQVYVDGKANKRTLICRHNAIRYFERIQQRNPTLSKMTFDELIEKGVNEYVFALETGEVCTTLATTFKVLLTKSGLLNERNTGDARTLYSFRHFYITQALIHKRMPIHVLAVQVGNSVPVIEAHYKHYIPKDYAAEIAGKVPKMA